MTGIPPAGRYNDSITNQQAKDSQDQELAVFRELLGGSEGEPTLVISAGAITPTKAVHAVDTEASAATDDLDLIDQTNHPDGRIILIRALTAGRTVVVRHEQGGVGEISLADGANFSLDSPLKWLMLKRKGNLWEEFYRSYGPDQAGWQAFFGFSSTTTTGTIKPTIIQAAESGWLLMNGDTVGSATSGATHADAQYEALFKAIWNNVDPAYATVSPSRGSTADADWSANKTITIPDTRGRFLVGFGAGVGLSTYVMGQTGGDEDAVVVAHTHAAGSLAADNGGSHNHSITWPTGTYQSTEGAGSNKGAGSANDTDNTFPSTTNSSGVHTHTISGSTASEGESATGKNRPPFLACNYQIKI